MRAPTHTLFRMPRQVADGANAGKRIALRLINTQTFNCVLLNVRTFNLCCGVIGRHRCRRSTLLTTAFFGHSRVFVYRMPKMCSRFGCVVHRCSDDSFLCSWIECSRTFYSSTWPLESGYTHTHRYIPVASVVLYSETFFFCIVSVVLLR